MFCKKGVHRNFAKSTGKQLCQSFFFNTVAKRRLWHMCFPVNFVKFVRAAFYRTTLVDVSVNITWWSIAELVELFTELVDLK